MILFHRTTAGRAKKILRNGFRDGTNTYLTSNVHTGVWLSNVPLDANEGAKGDTLLRLELPEEPISKFEWIEDGKPYREWLIPAALINGQSEVCIVDEEGD